MHLTLVSPWKVEFGGADQNNRFILELSDANGEFDAPIQLAITDENDSRNNTNYRGGATLTNLFGTDADIEFPTDVSGDFYKVRVRSTNPETVSDASPSFEAHYYDGTRLGFFTNNDVNFTPDDPDDTRGPLLTNVSICANDGGTGSFTLSVKHVDRISPQPITLIEPAATKYIWYRRTVITDEPQIIPNETGPNLVVSTAGIYEASFDLGLCTRRPNVSALSNLVTVTIEGDNSTQIVNQANEVVSGSPNPIQVCQRDDLELIPSPNNTTTTYRWFRDGNPLDTGGSSKLTVGNGGTNLVISGLYRLEATSQGGCTATVEVQVETKNPQIKIDKPDFLPVKEGERITLNVDPVPTSGTLQWFRKANDGTFVAIPDATDSSYTTDQLNDYRVRLSGVSGVRIPNFFSNCNVVYR